MVATFWLHAKTYYMYGLSMAEVPTQQLRIQYKCSLQSGHVVDINIEYYRIPRAELKLSLFRILGIRIFHRAPTSQPTVHSLTFGGKISSHLGGMTRRSDWPTRQGSQAIVR